MGDVYVSAGGIALRGGAGVIFDDDVSAGGLEGQFIGAGEGFDIAAGGVAFDGALDFGEGEVAAGSAGVKCALKIGDGHIAAGSAEGGIETARNDDANVDVQPGRGGRK